MEYCLAIMNDEMLSIIGKWMEKKLIKTPPKTKVQYQMATQVNSNKPSKMSSSINSAKTCQKN